MMQLDAKGLAAQQAAETARREAGKLGMRVLQQQMQVRTELHEPWEVTAWQSTSHGVHASTGALHERGRTVPTVLGRTGDKSRGC